MSKTNVLPEIPAEAFRYPYVTYTTVHGVTYYITQLRPDGVPTFTLWRKEAGGYRRSGTASSPLTLYDKIDEIERN